MSKHVVDVTPASTSSLAVPSSSSAAAASSIAQAATTPTRYRTLTFSAGFLCGQASLIFVAVLFLRYVVFEDPKVALREAGKRKKKRLRNSTSKRQRSQATSSSLLSTTTTSIPPNDALLLSKVSYDLSTHSPEPLDWLNVLLAQGISAYRGMILDAVRLEGEMGEEGRGAKGWVEDAMNQGRQEGEGIVTLDYITVTEFEFGQEYPIFSNARVRPSNESGKVRIEVDIDYSDHVSLGIETKVLINFPKPRFAIVPVSLALALVRFSATLTLEIPPPTSTSKASSSTSTSSTSSVTLKPASLSASLHPDFILELASTSLIGSRAKLQDIPKVEQMIIGRIRGWVIENLVWPRVRTFILPSVRGNGTKEEKEEEMKEDVRGEQQETPLSPRSGAEESAFDEEDDGRSGTTNDDLAGREEMQRRRASSASSSPPSYHSKAPQSSSGLQQPTIRLQTSTTNMKLPMRDNEKKRSTGRSSGVETAEYEGDNALHHRTRRRSSLSTTSTLGNGEGKEEEEQEADESSFLASSKDTTYNSPPSSTSIHSFNTRAPLARSLTSSTTTTSRPSFSNRERSESFARYNTPLHSPGLGLGFRPHAVSVSSSNGRGVPSSSASSYSSRSQPITPTHPLSRTNSTLSMSSLGGSAFNMETPRREEGRKGSIVKQSSNGKSSSKNRPQPVLRRRTSRVEEEEVDQNQDGHDTSEELEELAMAD